MGHAALRFLSRSTVSRARPGGPPISTDGKRVRITIGNGSRSEAPHGELVSSYAPIH